MPVTLQTEPTVVELEDIKEEVMIKPDCSTVGVDHIWYDSLGD